jgi:hypothetical protein
MNFAYPALLLFLLVLPGIILNYTYARGFWRWNSPTSIERYSEQIAYSIIAASILHLGWAYFLSFFGFDIDLEAVLVLLTGAFGPDDQYLTTTVQTLTNNPGRIAFYFYGLYLLSAILGISGHLFVRKTRLDRTTRLFRFTNEWYYLLSGEILEFAETPAEPRQFDGVYLSTIVQHGNENYLYRGIVFDFSYDRTGKLERVILRLAHRRLLSADRKHDQPRDTGDPGFGDDARYYDIEGDFFILNYEDMHTINIEYFALTDPSEPEEQPMELAPN